MNSVMLLYVLIIGGVLSFVLLVGVLIFFGKLIWLQLRIWMLARRGFVLIENVGEDRVRRYYYIRPKNNKFDIKDGFYIFLPENITKITGMLKKIDPSMLKEQPDYYDAVYDKLPANEQRILRARVEAQRKEYEELYEYVNKLQYHVDAVTLRWGIPTITYYGTDPNPVNFADRKKMYDASILRDAYLRLLLTQKYGMLKNFIMITAIAGCIIAVALIIHYFLLRGQVNNMSICQYSLNYSISQWQTCVNSTFEKLGVTTLQNSTITI